MEWIVEGEQGAYVRGYVSFGFLSVDFDWWILGVDRPRGWLSRSRDESDLFSFVSWGKGEYRIERGSVLRLIDSKLTWTINLSKKEHPWFRIEKSHWHQDSYYSRKISIKSRKQAIGEATVTAVTKWVDKSETTVYQPLIETEPRVLL